MYNVCELKIFRERDDIVSQVSENVNSFSKKFLFKEEFDMSNSEKIGTASSATSWLSTSISDLASESLANNLADVIMPFADLLPVGSYQSEIVAVTDAVQNGECVGIDCTHLLTNGAGKQYLVKFRLFAPHDIKELAKTLKSYGFSGDMKSALVGLKELLEIAPRPNSAKYVYISCRSKAEQSTNESSSQDKPPRKKGGLITSRRASPHSSYSSTAKSKNMLYEEDEEDEEDDDYLDEED